MYIFTRFKKRCNLKIYRNYIHFSFLIRGTLFEEKMKGVYISFIFRIDGMAIPNI